MSSPAAPDPSQRADRPWEGLGERLGRAATLDASLFREVADDPAATGPALAVVLAAAALSGLGRLFGDGLPGLFAGLGQGCLVWGLWLLGVHASSLLMGVESDLSRLFRALGFGAVGFALGLFEGLPLLGVLISLAKWGLVFAAFTVAVRAVSETELGRALVACGAGLLAAILLSVPFAPLFPG